MKAGEKTCFQCGTWMAFENYRLVDCRPVENPCEGTIRLLAIYDEVERRRTVQVVETPADDAVDLTSQEVIEARLRAMTQRPEPARDWAKAAAGDVD